MRVWIIQTGDRYGGMEIARVPDDSGADRTFKPQVFADTAEGYHAALLSFRTLVGERIGSAKAVYSYPGQLCTDARVHIIARDGHGDDWDDAVELAPFEVLAG